MVTNGGTINGSDGCGVVLDAGGSVTNADGGSILGENHIASGVEIINGLGTVANDGEIYGGFGNAVVLDHGVNVTYLAVPFDLRRPLRHRRLRS